MLTKSKHKKVQNPNGHTASKDHGKTEPELICAASTTTFSGEAPERIVYMPAGKWSITPTVNGKPDTVEVDVTSEVAAVLQSSLEKRLESKVRPYAQFNHKPGPASFFPKKFEWDAASGVILEVDWTKSGKSAIEGRDYSYFSPSFLFGEGKVVGLPEKGEIGSLTNNPAFREMQKIAAEDMSTAVNKNPNIVNAVLEKMVELEIISAQDAENTDEDGVVSAVETLHKSNLDLQKENVKLKTRIQKVQETEVNALIQAAIDEGKIPPKDDELIAEYKVMLVNKPETAKRILASLTPNPALKTVITLTSENKGDKVQPGNKDDLIQAQHKAIKLVRASHPNLEFTDAFNKAKEDNPTLFPPE